mmetsp:Transcript_45185/g.113762  ORF Transcript_45185/g.113762 Transcript_45185/m.113762 type:complete len:83 (+) Transcript_45185:108-356(+)
MGRKRVNSCDLPREELIDCIKFSNCIKRDNHTFHECLKGIKHGDECYAKYSAYILCRKNLLNMRMRFRGNVDVEFEDAPENS